MHYCSTGYWPCLLSGQNLVLLKGEERVCVCCVCVGGGVKRCVAAYTSHSHGLQDIVMVSGHAVVLLALAFLV